MSHKWEKQEGNEGLLTVTVPAEEFDQALDEAFVKVSKDISGCIGYCTFTKLC